MTKSQIFLYLCLAFVAGVTIASFVTISLLLFWAVSVFSVCVLCYGITKGRKEYIVYGSIGLMLLFGAWRFIQASSLAPKALENLLGQTVRFDGFIADEPVIKEKSQEIIFKETASGNSILLRLRKYPQYNYGAYAHISGKLERPENFSEDFDYEAYLAKDDIYYVINFPEIVATGEVQRDTHFYLYLLKSKFSESINSSLPEPHASFLSGLLLGEKRAIPKNLLEDFKTTGTTHIVALSGYNITIVADSIVKFLALLSIPFGVSFWLALSSVALFTLLTGASASVVRAAVMGILVLVARREGRLYSIRNALVFAGAVMIFQNPKILRFDTAFQLSFLATLGLVYISPIIDGYFEKIKIRFLQYIQPRFLEEQTKHSKKSFLREIFISTLSAQCAVLPLLIYSFGSISLISPITNLLVLSAIPATMFFGFFTGVAGLISALIARLLMPVAWLLLQYEISVIE
ncbi:MAG: ComEC/Rec2 family competence protein, partial [Candidatus Sungbacteria bacterium]|nr:ComEC/Rec2 family competence protein [Candidatus Sungbacteria bacterium]